MIQIPVETILLIAIAYIAKDVILWVRFENRVTKLETKFDLFVQKFFPSSGEKK